MLRKNIPLGLNSYWCYSTLLSPVYITLHKPKNGIGFFIVLIHHCTGNLIHKNSIPAKKKKQRKRISSKFQIKKNDLRKLIIIRRRIRDKNLWLDHIGRLLFIPKVLGRFTPLLLHKNSHIIRLVNLSVITIWKIKKNDKDFRFQV